MCIWLTTVERTRRKKTDDSARKTAEELSEKLVQAAPECVNLGSHIRPHHTIGGKALHTDYVTPGSHIIVQAYIRLKVSTIEICILES